MNTSLRTIYSLGFAILSLVTIVIILLFYLLAVPPQPVTVIYYQQVSVTNTPEPIQPTATPQIVSVSLVTDTITPNVVYIIIPQTQVVYSIQNSQNSVVESTATYTLSQEVPSVPLEPSVPTPTVDGYLPWSPYIEPTLANVINLDAPNLDEEMDRVYYGIVGTRTPAP